MTVAVEVGLLPAMLEVAVPLQIKAVRGWTPSERVEFARAHADTIASQGDDLQFGARRRGETARLFNVTARTVACLAYQPGGVTLFGVHWDAEPGRRE